MPTVKYKEDLQSHKKGDTAWLDANSAAEQEELGVLEIVEAEDPELTLEEQREQTLRGVREAAEEKAKKSSKK